MMERTRRVLKAPKLTEKWNFGIAVLATILSIVSLSVSVKSCSLSARSMKTHLEPQLTCVLDDHPTKPGFLLFTLKNDGPIPATAVSVDHRTLRYTKAERRIRFGGATGEAFPGYSDPGVRWIFVDRLGPNQLVQKLTGESAIRNAALAVDVLQFDIEYFRDTDGERFSKRCLYFVDGREVLSQSIYRGHADYSTILGEVARFNAANPTIWSPDASKKE